MVTVTDGTMECAANVAVKIQAAYLPGIGER